MNYIGLIKNIQELEDYLKLIFTKTSYYQNVEWAEIESGKRIKISIDFWRGPFNESPIQFRYITSYMKEVDKNHLLMSIIGSLSISSFYYFRIYKDNLKIHKNMELM